MFFEGIDDELDFNEKKIDEFQDHALNKYYSTTRDKKRVLESLQHSCTFEDVKYRLGLAIGYITKDRQWVFSAIQKARSFISSMRENRT